VDNVFALLRGDSIYERPISERHRTIFYVGHVEAFDQNLLRETGRLPEFNPALDRLFAFGIDPDSSSLPSDAPSDWPDRGAVGDYCAQVRENVDACWNQAPEQLRCVALEHRLMHAETLAYMLHNFPHDRLVRPGAAESSESNGPVRRSGVGLEVPLGVATLGRHCNEGFGWDNEFPRTDVEVDRFVIEQRKVSNGEYLDFVRAGGSTPHFWVERGGTWFLRRMFDEIPLPLDWPAWVTHNQAASYAGWRGGRLPSEAEWHRASEGADFAAGNFDARRFDPEPVDANRTSVSRWGVEDLCGNGWEWTSSPFRPFPGFEPFSFYPGYSANFFDEEHFVLKGASPRTDAVFTRHSFRNWFRRDYPYVFAGFRCIHKS